MMGLVLFWIRNAAGVALHRVPRLVLPLSREAQTSCFFCTRGWLHHYHRQNMVLLLWTEVPKHLLCPPFPELCASIKGTDKTLRRFFSKDLKNVCLPRKLELHKNAHLRWGCHQFTGMEIEAKYRWTWTCPPCHHTKQCHGWGRDPRGLCLHLGQMLFPRTKPEELLMCP